LAFASKVIKPDSVANLALEDVDLHPFIAYYYITVRVKNQKNNGKAIKSHKIRRRETLDFFIGGEFMKKGLGLILVLCFVLGGCAPTKTLIISGAVYPDKISLEPLKRSEYEVLGQTKGYGCAKYYGLWPIPVWWYQSGTRQAGKADSWKLYSGSLTRRAKSIAVYSALEKIPEADILLEPRFHVTSETSGIWYARKCVEVIGKGINIKKDEEIIRSGPKR
jgi:hypothetical protein